MYYTIPVETTMFALPVETTDEYTTMHSVLQERLQADLYAFKSGNLRFPEPFPSLPFRLVIPEGKGSGNRRFPDFS